MAPHFMDIIFMISMVMVTIIMRTMARMELNKCELALGRIEDCESGFGSAQKNEQQQ